MRLRVGPALLALLLATPAFAQQVAITLRSGAQVQGELEHVDETRLRVRTSEASRDVPLGEVDAIDLPARPGPTDATALRLRDELAAMLELGAAGELLHVARLDARLSQLVAELADEPRRAAWAAWPRWPLSNARGVVRGATHLDALVPVVARAARAMVDRGEAPDGPLRLLRALDTPSSRGALLGLYLDPRFWEREHAPRFVPLLIDLDDPRIGAVVRARHARDEPIDGRRGEPAWEHLALLLRHGGGDVLTDVQLRLARDASSPESRAAWTALRFARGRGALDVALSYLRWNGASFGADPRPDAWAMEAAAGLVEAFGADAVAALVEATRDPRLDARRRALAAGALARACPVERVPVAHLLALDADGAQALSLAEAVRGLTTRADLELRDDDRPRLVAAVVRLLERAEPAARAAGIEAVRARRDLHLASVRQALRQARDRGAAEPELEAVLREVEATLSASTR